MRHLKYQGWLHLAEICARHMTDSIGLDALDWLVPVPLHSVRLRARGYNQARAIAEVLAAASGLPLIDALDRSRATRSQVGLGRPARAANVSGAFVCRWTPARAVGLVDDVTTSGATMVEAAQALLSEGAERVVGLAFALAPEDAPG
ncbi:MAG: ComF family protein [Gemmatimonadota bacterium]